MNANDMNVRVNLSVATRNDILTALRNAIPRQFDNVPEAQLWLHVIHGNLADLNNKKKRDYALDYFNSPRFCLHCSMLTIEPDYAVRILKQYGALH